MKELIIGLGSNLGDRQEQIKTAIRKIGERVGPVVAVSELTETEPWGFESQNRFLNGVVIVQEAVPETAMPGPYLHRVIGILQEIEAESGRVRTGVYTDRAIDLDILFYGDEVFSEPGLEVPHPRLHARDFVMIPLMELCPEKVHPVLGKTIRELWNSQRSQWSDPSIDLLP